MSIEQNLNSRIVELENALREIRRDCAWNLDNPGNENDTLEGIMDQVTIVLHGEDQ